MCVCEGFTSPEVVQVSNNPSSPGSTPRRRSADTAMSSRRKLSASKEPKLSVDALNELNKKNKTGSDSNLPSYDRDSVVKDTPPKTTTKTDSPSIEISNSLKKFNMDTKVSDRRTQRSPSPLAQEKKTAGSMTRQEAVSDIRRSRGLLNGEAKVNGDDKVITTAKPPLVASKEPVVTSKPPTAKPHDSNRDSKSNSLKNTSKNEHPVVVDVKDAAKEQSAISPPSRRISQYRPLSGSEALHIFHPTRRSVYGDMEHSDDSRTNSPAPPSKSPVPDKRLSTRDSKLGLNNITEEKTAQQQLPAPPKSPGVTSVTGTKRPGVVEHRQNALFSGKEEESTTQQEPPPPPKSPGASVTRRPGNVESKQKKMLALLGKEASVDTDRVADIPRTSPVSMYVCISDHFW